MGTPTHGQSCGSNYNGCAVCSQGSGVSYLFVIALFQRICITAMNNIAATKAEDLLAAQKRFLKYQVIFYDAF